MKKILYTIVLLFAVAITASAQAKIQFEKTSHNFGQFSESDAIQTCVFTFTNAGNQPLVLNNVVPSCGCTTPTYTKTPIAPGEKGEIKVKYNGTGKYPARFKKSITVRTNGSPEVTRLYIEGEMTEDAAAKK